MNGVCRFVAVAVVLLMVGCGSVAPDAGQEGVLVRKPLFFGHGGVDQTPVKAGRSFIAWTTQAIYVDTRPLQVNVEFDDLMSRDGVPLDFNAAVRFKINNSVKMVQFFGADDHFFARNLEQAFRNLVRDAVKKRGMNETAIDASAAEAIDREVTDGFKLYVAQGGFPIDVLDVTVGRANPPDSIKNQRTETATQEQRSNTEKQRKLAEDQRREAEASRATADNAYREAMRLSPDQFLQLEQIKMLHEVCQGGKCSFLLGAGAVPTIQVR